MTWLSWIGNIFIILGLYYIGNKKRFAFIFSVVGETSWIGYALLSQQYNLAFICIIFAGMAIRNWFKWK